MKAAQIALTGGALLIAYSLFRKGAGAQTINWYPVDVTDINLDGISPVMTLRLAAQNTSNQSFTLKSFAGNLFANDFLVGNVSSFTTQTIFPNKQNIIEVKVKLSWMGIVNDIVRAFSYGNFSQDLQLDAYANVDNLQVPLDLNYKVGA